jgi:HNH endonuclease
MRKRRTKPLAQRIEETSIPEPNGGCWIWLGVLFPNGYGSMGIGRRSLGEKKTAYTHRISYLTFVGPIPKGKELDHLCRLRCCVNPRHLEPVTRRENTIRGNAPRLCGLLNGSKTRCKRGHPFDEVNTRFRPTGGRSCRTCAREDARKKRKENVAD